MEITALVELPDNRKYGGQACDDPAVEAAMSGLSSNCEVFLWGKENDPARVYYDAHEDDCEIEEDEREDDSD
jgi:hypothetical protein